MSKYHWVEVAPGRKRYVPIEPPSGPQKTTSRAYNRPLLSRSHSLPHPANYREHNEDLKKAGVTGAYYDPKGDLYFESQAARRAFCEHRQIGDADAGYRDRPPGG